jgi:hypothetical protein
LARALNKLTDLAIRKAKEGWYGDGGGLYLRIDQRGSRRWVFVYQWAGKRTEMGLGALADVPLAEARTQREKWRKAVRDGVNPATARRLERAASQSQTFAAWAEEIAPSLAPKAEKARKAWLKMLTEWTGR